jgi:hypothetical protein
VLGKSLGEQPMVWMIVAGGMDGRALDGWREWMGVFTQIAMGMRGISGWNFFTRGKYL